MNRLDNRIKLLNKEKRSGLVCYFTAGDPNYGLSLDLFNRLGENGADIIEIGMPFSDPIADGEIIQAAHIRALESGQTLKKTLCLVRKIREKDDNTPIILMGYLNPILQYGVEKFITEAKGIVDGILINDLPYEYQEDYIKLAFKNNIHFICLTTSETPSKRLELFSKTATGFLYHVTQSGVTGVQLNKLDHLLVKVDELRCYFNIPIGVGFGIKNINQISELSGKVDFIIVGSELVETLVTEGVEKTLDKVKTFSSILK